jgi:hypothetical protein
MKLNLNERTARKVLAVTAGLADPDLVALRATVNDKLAAVTAVGVLTGPELQALLVLVDGELAIPKHLHPDDRSARPDLRTAEPKLKAMLARRRAEAGA